MFFAKHRFIFRGKRSEFHCLPLIDRCIKRQNWRNWIMVFCFGGQLRILKCCIYTPDEGPRRNILKARKFVVSKHLLFICATILPSSKRNLHEFSLYFGYFFPFTPGQGFKNKVRKMILKRDSNFTNQSTILYPGSEKKIKKKKKFFFHHFT